MMTEAGAQTRGTAGRIVLPSPGLCRTQTVEEAIRARRSVRDFARETVTLDEISQILWAAQGITHPAGYRTAPSAGALYPLEISLIAGAVDSLAPGLFRYDPQAHALDPGTTGDRRAAIAGAAMAQGWIADAAAVLIVAAVAERTTAHYGPRGVRYVHIEAGHAAQNVYLQAAALGLGTTIVGAFDDDAVIEIAELRPDEAPLCLLPIGRA